MDILCIIIFGCGFIRTIYPFLNKKSFSTLPIFIGVFVNAFLYGICYVYFLNNLLNK